MMVAAWKPHGSSSPSPMWVGLTSVGCTLENLGSPLLYGVTGH